MKTITNFYLLVNVIITFLYEFIEHKIKDKISKSIHV